MMKQLKYGTTCLLLLAAACGDDSDAFYTAVYPVVRSYEFFYCVLLTSE